MAGESKSENVLPKSTDGGRPRRSLSFGAATAARRKLVSDTTAVRLGCECACPVVYEIHAQVEGMVLPVWVERNIAMIEEQLLQSGAILFRGFRVPALEEFEAAVLALGGTLLNYEERSSPRSLLRKGIYSSTDHPATELIFFHNENSYQNRWPRRITFHCRRAPADGGATPLAAIRNVTRLLVGEASAKFEQHGVLYQRVYRPDVGLPWQTAFQTSSRHTVEEYCREDGIDMSWIGADCLRTRQVRPAFAAHPATGEKLWFNHAAFFHASTLPPEVRRVLVSTYGADALPNNTYYGDGSNIEDSEAERIRQAYWQSSGRFAWREGDVLVLDNMLMAHGREPFRGERNVVVAMSGLQERKSLKTASI